MTLGPLRLAGDESSERMFVVMARLRLGWVKSGISVVEGRAINKLSTSLYGCRQQMVDVLFRVVKIKVKTSSLSSVRDAYPAQKINQNDV
jgi:hypothetical protein